MAVEAFLLSLSPMWSFYNSALLDSPILLTWKPPVFALREVGTVGGAAHERGLSIRYVGSTENGNSRKERFEKTATNRWHNKGSEVT